MRSPLAPLLAGLVLTSLTGCTTGSTTPLTTDAIAGSVLADVAFPALDLTDDLRDAGALQVSVTRTGLLYLLRVQVTNSLSVPIQELKIIIIDNPATRGLLGKPLVLLSPDALLPGATTTLHAVVGSATVAKYVQVTGVVN